MVTWFCVCSVSAWRTLMVLSDPTTMINYCGIIYYNNSVPCKRAWSSLTHEKKLKFNAKISGSTVCHYPAGIAGEVHIYMLGVPSSTLPPLPPLPTPTPTPQKSWYHNTCFLQWQRMLWQSLVVSLWPSKEVWGHAPLDILTPREYLWDLLTVLIFWIIVIIWQHTTENDQDTLKYVTFLKQRPTPYIFTLVLVNKNQ